MEKKTCSRAGVCQFIRLYSYLSDDLAVLSVDLSDASPLCQEGEDLIELEEEDGETVKLQWRCFYILSPALLFTQNQALLLILGVTLKPQFNRNPQFT